MDQLAKTRQHHRKERLKIFLKEFSSLKVIWWKLLNKKVAKVYTGGQVLPPATQTSVKFVDLTKSYFRGFGRHFVNYKALILAVSISFHQLVHIET